MFRNKLGKFKMRTPRVLPLFAALIGAVALVGAMPASAAPNTVYTVDPGKPNGSARFQLYGDHMYLCDHKEDGHSVGVWLDYSHEGGGREVEWRWNWWGPNKYGGCEDVNLKVKEYSTIRFAVCLGDYAHPGGKVPNVIYSSCSDITAVYNNG